MALITRSIEMSFSASRLRRTVTSMSIWSLLVRIAGVLAGAVEMAGVVVRQAAELHLHPAWSELAVDHRPLRAIYLQRDALVISPDDSCLLRSGSSRGIPLRMMIVVRQRDDDQPPDRALPVPGFGQRPVDSWRGHLEGVGGVAHRVLRVEPRRYLAADLGDLVQANAAVGIDDNSKDSAPAHGPDRDGLDVDIHRAEHGFD